ncbi:hypothetical protein EDC04DRAFT_2608617 [Pisolithus marmoratus]|nr:hypothetical protein EDC04DRAFT_2608617 [Pisolithus marmoratus]
MKRSAPSTLQVTSKARRLLSPNLDLEEDDEYEPDTLTEEEEEEEDADVDPDAPSWEVGPEDGEGIFERMTTTVSKCQPSIAPFRRHPNGVTPTSDAGIGKTGGANGDEYSHFTCNICYQSFPSKSKCNPHKRRECQESGTIKTSHHLARTGQSGPDSPDFQKGPPLARTGQIKLQSSQNPNPPV